MFDRSPFNFGPSACKVSPRPSTSAATMAGTAKDTQKRITNPGKTRKDRRVAIHKPPDVGAEDSLSTSSRRVTPATAGSAAPKAKMAVKSAAPRRRAKVRMAAALKERLTRGLR